MKWGRNKIVLTVGKLALSLALLAYVLSKADIASMYTMLRAVHLWYYLLSVLLFFALIPPKTLRWGLFLQTKQVRIPQVKLMVFYCIGLFFNMFGSCL